MVDSTGAYTHYGRLQPADEAAGTVVFTLPELPEGSTLYIFNEQCNGDYKTDYASHLVELTVPEDTSGAGADGREVELKNDGASGVGIAELALNESGELVVTLTDGTEKNLGKITGEDGVGIAGVAINEKGELIVTLTDGTELNAGAVPAGAAAPGLEPLVYIALGTAVISLAGMIVMAAYLLAKRKSLLTQA